MPRTSEGRRNAAAPQPALHFSECPRRLASLRISRLKATWPLVFEFPLHALPSFDVSSSTSISLSRTGRWSFSRSRIGFAGRLGKMPSWGGRRKSNGRSGSRPVRVQIRRWHSSIFPTPGDTKRFTWLSSPAYPAMVSCPPRLFEIRRVDISSTESMSSSSGRSTRFTTCRGCRWIDARHERQGSTWRSSSVFRWRIRGHPARIINGSFSIRCRFG
jgi:hypothetical protein